jgi:hypothetical protein
MKLVVTIDPAWSRGVHEVEVELDPSDYDYLDMENPEDKTYFDRCMMEIAEDTFNEEVYYGWEVVE